MRFWECSNALSARHEPPALSTARALLRESRLLPPLVAPSTTSKARCTSLASWLLGALTLAGVLALLMPQSGGAGAARLDTLLAVQDIHTAGHSHLGAGNSVSCEPWRVSRGERCHYLHTHMKECAQGGSLTAYLHFHFCVLGRWWWMSYILLALCFLFLFAVLLTAAEKFFCPALELISDYLKLSPSMAGATLLSFGNGAPDTFTMLAAANEGRRGQLQVLLSEPLGGGLFVTNIVLGCVIFVSARHGKVTVKRASFLKDLLFYFAALFAGFLCMMDKKMTLWECCVLLGLYVAYVVTTVFMSRADEPVHADPTQHEMPLTPSTCSLEGTEGQSDGKRDKRREARRLHSNLSNSVREGLTVHLLTAPTRGDYSDDAVYNSPDPAQEATKLQLLVTLTDGDRETDAVPDSPACVENTSTIKWLDATGVDPEHPATPSPNAASMVSASSKEASSLFSDAHSLAVYNKDNVPDDVEALSIADVGVSTSARGAESLAAASPAAASPSPVERRDQHIGKSRQPLRLFCGALSTTVPKLGSHGHRYRRELACCLPFTVPLVWMASVNGPLPWNIDVQYAIIAATVGAGTTWALYPRDHVPRGQLKGFYTVLTFVVAMLWMNLVANYLLQLCVVLARIVGIPAPLLGATLLAWGNAIPDAVVNIAMALDGFPTMSITACFAGPLFTLLPGLGSALTYAVIKGHGTLELPVDVPLEVMFAFAVANLFLILLVALFNKFKFGRTYCIMAFLFYIVYNAVFLYSVVRQK